MLKMGKRMGWSDVNCVLVTYFPHVMYISHLHMYVCTVYNTVLIRSIT